MKNKLKYLLFGLLTLVSFSSATNAYDLDKQGSFQGSRNVATACVHMDRFNGIKGMSAAYVGDTCPSDKVRLKAVPSGYWLGYGSNMNQGFFSFVGLQRKGEGVEINHGVRKSPDTLENKVFSFPSRAGYSYGGKLLDRVIYWNNTFYLFDKDRTAGVGFLGNTTLKNFWVLAHPGLDTDNLWIISLKEKKAWSKTIDKKLAWDFMLGKPEVVKTVQTLTWDNSYKLTDGGDSVFPPNFYPDKQGESLGLVYTKDIDPIQPPFNEGDKPKEDGSSIKTEAQYNQCIAKYINMRALTAHSDGCFGTDYNNEERMKYWHDVIDDSDNKYTTRDKTRYWRCYMFANYKSGLKKKLGEARDPFWKEWKSEYLGLEAKDVNPELLCGSKPTSSKKDEDYSYFAKPENNPVLKAWDWLRGRRGEPALITEKGEKLYDVDFQSDYNDLRSLYWQCQGLDRFGITKSLTQTPEQKQSACSKYASKKAEILKKWQGAKLGDFWDNSAEKSIQKLEKKYVKGLASNFANDFKDTFSDLSDNGEALLNSVKVPFNSGYNAILPLKCSNNTHIEMMDYILWGLFAILAFTFFRML